ncbi:MAG: hypothetical protein K2N05_04535 [Muribaculaceae bacterium]|nr:hypothetical protein [Muribaculaceae bacterium]
MKVKDIQIELDFLATDLIQMLMETYGWDMLKALDVLYNSTTYAKLSDPECGLYFQSAVYVFDFLKNEIETGKIA